MRIAAISDIHGNLPALEAVLTDIERRGVDLVVNLGDLVSGPLWPAETAQLLMSCNFATISGNHERQLLEDDLVHMGRWDRLARETLGAAEIGWLASLPATLRPLSDVLLCHGIPDSDLDYLLETVTDAGRRQANEVEVRRRIESEAASLILCGHSHTSRSLRLRQGVLVHNPGSVGLQAFRWDRPFAHEVASGSPKARYAIVDKREARWHATAIALDYRHDLAARRAAEFGAMDWAYSLETGQNTPLA